MPESAGRVLVSELADNWPAFVYIAMMIVFSIQFFRDRRAEQRAIEKIGAGIREKLERLENLIERHLRAD